MKLIASLIVRNEWDRYLGDCICSLLEFCDEIRILNDGSEDRADAYFTNVGRVFQSYSDEGIFFTHEGAARQKLVDWTLKGSPTHVLAIDADEFISDGAALRRQLELHPNHPVLTLCMQEIWKAEEELYVRMDGGWVPHEVSCVWQPSMIPNHKMRNVALACGRIPQAAEYMVRRSVGFTGVDILHFGWACEADRNARYQRYVEHDNGNFHAKHHLDSIMWPDSRVQLCKQNWPDGMVWVQDSVRERAGREGT